MFNIGDDNTDLTGGKRSTPTRVTYGIFVFMVFIVLVSVILVSEQADTTIAKYVAPALPFSGVDNPVTAVLLNFRSYDTLLEIAVLLIVAVAVMPSNKRLTAGNPTTNGDSALPALHGFATWFMPITVIMAGYLLWTGAYAPGGAFQAGAILAGAGILVLQLRSISITVDSLLMQTLLAIGLVVFLGMATLTYFFNGMVLQYLPSEAGWQILVIEIAATITISIILVMLYVSLATDVSDTSADEKEAVPCSHSP